MGTFLNRKLKMATKRKWQQLEMEAVSFADAYGLPRPSALPSNSPFTDMRKKIHWDEENKKLKKLKTENEKLIKKTADCQTLLIELTTLYTDPLFIDVTPISLVSLTYTNIDTFYATLTKEKRRLKQMIDYE